MKLNVNIGLNPVTSFPIYRKPIKSLSCSRKSVAMMSRGGEQL